MVHKTGNNKNKPKKALPPSHTGNMSFSTSSKTKPSPRTPKTPLAMRILNWMLENITAARLGWVIGKFFAQRSEQVSFPKPTQELKGKVEISQIYKDHTYFEKDLAEQIRKIKGNKTDPTIDQQYANDCARIKLSFSEENQPCQFTKENAIQKLKAFSKECVPEGETEQASFILNLSGLLCQTTITSVETFVALNPTSPHLWNSFGTEDKDCQFKITKENDTVRIKVTYQNLAASFARMKDLTYLTCDPQSSHTTSSLDFSIPIAQLKTDLQVQDGHEKFANPLTITINQNPSIEGQIKIIGKMLDNGETILYHSEGEAQKND